MNELINPVDKQRSKAPLKTTMLISVHQSCNHCTPPTTSEEIQRILWRNEGAGIDIKHAPRILHLTLCHVFPCTVQRQRYP